MLTHQHFGESVGVHFRLAFGLGDFVEFAEGLPDRLANFRRVNALPPTLDFRRFGRHRMPERDGLRDAEVYRLAGRIGHAFPGPHSGALPSLIVPENPDEPAAKETEQG